MLGRCGRLRLVRDGGVVVGGLVQSDGCRLGKGTLMTNGRRSRRGREGTRVDVLVRLSGSVIGTCCCVEVRMTVCVRQVCDALENGRA